MIGVEIFSGAGGMSLGASLAGVNVMCGVDINASCTETFKHNHPDATVINSDIRKVRNINIEKNVKEQSILFGGPPCQGFSKSNHRTRNSENPNNWLYKEFARISNSWKPDWVVLENVQGLLGTEGGVFLDQILKQFKKIGYTTSFEVLNAKDFCVPQNRERLFIVGSLHGIEFDFPQTQLSRPITVRQAINDLPALENGNSILEMKYKSKKCSAYAQIMRSDLEISKNHGVSRNTEIVLNRYEYIPQGGNWQNIPTKLMKSYTDSSRCHSGIYHRLDENKESVVIGNYRKNMLIHPNENRGLSVREAARLQSFPDFFEFKGQLGDQQQQVGNAVPPNLAKAVFNQILTY
jgi:DNA (cytosine-5)-methyltransferase 1